MNGPVGVPHGAAIRWYRTGSASDRMPALKAHAVVTLFCEPVLLEWRAAGAYRSRVPNNSVPHERRMEQPVWNFEQEPDGERLDETGVNLRAYFDRMPDEKMQQYCSDWTDEQTIDWDDNFREDGNLMLLCCERDVDVREYRKVLENCINYRNRVRAIVTKDR